MCDGLTDNEIEEFTNPVNIQTGTITISAKKATTKKTKKFKTEAQMAKEVAERLKAHKESLENDFFELQIKKSKAQDLEDRIVENRETLSITTYPVSWLVFIIRGLGSLFMKDSIFEEIFVEQLTVGHDLQSSNPHERLGKNRTTLSSSKSSKSVQEAEMKSMPVSETKSINFVHIEKKATLTHLEIMEKLVSAYNNLAVPLNPVLPLEVQEKIRTAQQKQIDILEKQAAEFST